MTDMERVVRDLRYLKSFGRVSNNPQITEIAEDALALLKKQEAVEPKKENDGNPEPWTAWWYVCGDCGQPIDRMDRYCRRCGKQVKWDA